MLVAVASVKSGGCTTLAATLAAVWPGEPGVLVEADPAGGDLGGWHGVPDSPGLASLANACRGAAPVSLAQHTVRLSFGLDVAPAAAGRAQATAAIGLLADADPALWAKERPTVLDVGRLEPDSAALALVRAADVVLVVAGVDVLSLLRVSLAEVPYEQARLVLVGPLVHRRDEIAASLPLPVVAQLPWDRHAAEVIAGRRRAGRGWTRVGLPAAVRGLATALAFPQPIGGDQK